ncbi:hypothetical protein [Pragia fontium]|uniref:hypothetical protein n=1 Tax=Pragia fontium TaxID=82985 RepID=UPI0006496B03|nr:hypothetical protein [Pragia fontium]AKJ41827.1 hypothetical protein QQ39_06800 [Pragia fontium]
MKIKSKLQCLLIIPITFTLISCEDSREEKAIAAAKRLSVHESSKPRFRNVIFIQTPSDDKNPDSLKGNVCGEVKFNDPTGTYTDFTRFFIEISTYENGERSIASGLDFEPKDSRSCKNCFEQSWQSMCISK